MLNLLESVSHDDVVGLVLDPVHLGHPVLPPLGGDQRRGS